MYRHRTTTCGRSITFAKCAESYAARYKERLRIVSLADDVAAAFADEAAVIEALRDYLKSRQGG
jgi:hypothetical protein